MSHTHPAIDFPVYGLAGWRGPQWLDSLEGEAGKPIAAVWLAHRTGDEMRHGFPYVKIGTLSLRQYGCVSPTLHTDETRSSREVAFAAMLKLLNMTSPILSREEQSKYSTNAVRFAEQQADRHADWQAVDWSINGRRVDARVLEWSGAWVAFTRSLHPDVAVVAVGGGGAVAEGLAIYQVNDQADYYFDVTAAISFPETLERSRTIVLGPVLSIPTVLRQPPHVDQQLLLN